MAAETVEKLNRELDCAVCMNTLKNPKSLSCTHSFCEECLTQCGNASEVSSSTIKCPICRKTTTLPAEGVSGLKSDPLICRVLEVLEAKKNSSEIACDACGDSESPLTTYCRDCLHFICDSCACSHARMKILMKDHRPVPLEKIVNGSIKIKWMEEGLWKKAYECDEHRGEIRRFYCRTCMKRICRDCIVLDHTKPDHDCTTVQKMFQETQEKVKDRLKSCLKKEESVHNMLSDVDRKETEISKRIRNIKDKIQELKVMAMQDLNKTEEEILQKVEVFEGKLNLKLNNFKSKLKTSTEILTRLQLKAKDIVSAQEVTDLSSGPFLPEDVLQELEKELASEVTMTISRDLLSLKGTIVQGASFSTQMSPFATLSLPNFWQESQMIPIPDKDIVRISCDGNAVYVACKNGIYKKLLFHDAESSTWIKLNQESIKQVVDMAMAVENSTLSVLAEQNTGETKLFRFKLDEDSRFDQVLIGKECSLLSFSSCRLNKNARITVDSQAHVIITDNNHTKPAVHPEKPMKENGKDCTPNMSPSSLPFGRPADTNSVSLGSRPTPSPGFSFAPPTTIKSSSPSLFGQASTTKRSSPFSFGTVQVGLETKSSAAPFALGKFNKGTNPQTASKGIESKADFGSSILTPFIKVYQGHPSELTSAPQGFNFGVERPPAEVFDNFTVPFDKVISLAAAESGQLVFLRGDKKAVIITDSNGTVQHEIKEPGRMYLSISCTESDALFVLSAFWGSHSVTLTKHSLDDGRVLEYIIDELDVSAGFKSDEWPEIGNHGNDLIFINTGKNIRVYTAEDWDILADDDGDEIKCN